MTLSKRISKKLVLFSFGITQQQEAKIKPAYGVDWHPHIGKSKLQALVMKKKSQMAGCQAILLHN